MRHPKLELINLVKEYEDGAVVAVDKIDLEIQAGETLALLGPSGCGKSTTLNMVVGLEEPTSGDILIDGQSVVRVPAGKRNVGLVFQDYAVFTTMSVRRNLAFGLEVRGTPKSEIKRAVEEVAELLDMRDQLDARIRDLGGSELQRVAIGRTLVTKPAILLLDEPLSNLEYAARLSMRRELRRLQSEIGLTIIYVTHDQIEALSLADRIAVMNAGKILQVEDSAVICQKPDHIFVAGFLGSPPMNLVRGKFEAGPSGVRFEKTQFSLPVKDSAPRGDVPKGWYTMGIRPDTLRLVPENEGQMTGRVSLVEPRGPEVMLTVEVGMEELKVVTPSGGRFLEGETTGLRVEPGELTFFDGDYNRRIEVNL